MIYILSGGGHGFKYRIRDFVPGRQNKFFENSLILIIRSANLIVAPPIYLVFHLLIVEGLTANVLQISSSWKLIVLLQEAVSRKKQKSSSKLTVEIEN